MLFTSRHRLIGFRNRGGSPRKVFRDWIHAIRGHCGPAHGIPNPMKPPIAIAFCCSLIPASISAQTLLFSDSFDVADTTNFDGAPLVLDDGVTNRRSGTLAETVFLRSAQQQQHISNQQVSLRGGSRLRFHDDINWYNWASGTAGTDILAEGGLRVEFDWVPTDTTATNWVAFNVGFPGTGEPGTRVNNLPTDFGILFRNNGGTERFDNSANLGPGGTFPATASSRHVTIDYAFDSFANGTIVRMRASVDGVRVSENQFSWDDNNGALYMELETNQLGSLIDNYSVSTIPADLEIAIDNTSFISGLGQGGLIGTLSVGTFSLGAEDATFELVTGEGSDNNGLFQVVGNELQVGDFDFSGENSFDGSQYFVRVSGTGSESGATVERAFVLDLTKDDDSDGISDTWEFAFAGNLTDLDGLATGPGPGAGTGDFDGDGINDLEEYNFSLAGFPDISPILADTDGDGLNDGEEIIGAGSRPPTNPTLADTDGDGINDRIESNSTVFVNVETDTGTDPTLTDSDGDGARDGFEVDRGSEPNDIASLPPLPPAFKIVELTDDASTGISASKTYTHLISGGSAATVNEVAFEPLTDLITPSNFSWDVIGGGLKGNIPANNGDWVPGLDPSTGAGLRQLLGGFSYNTFAGPGGAANYTLTGLVPGQSYELRLYSRIWDTDGSGRPIDLFYNNGATVEQPFGAFLFDRPNITLPSGDGNAAYYISYTYVAEGTELVVQSSIHSSANVGSGSHHLYALTNESLSPPSGELRITGVSRDSGGNFIIDFLGEPETTYEVTKSADLATPFAPLTEPVMPQTNASGVGQATVPASEASEPSEFYRIEE